MDAGSRLLARRSTWAKAALATAATTLALALFPTPGHAQGCGNAGLSLDQGNGVSVEAAVHCLVNVERSSRGLPPLTKDPNLTAAARAHAGDMVTRNYFAHNSPEGTGPGDRVRGAGYPATGAIQSWGENLAWASGPLATASVMLAQWMASDGHRANILRADFREIGVGAAFGAPQKGFNTGGILVTTFGSRLKNAPASGTAGAFSGPGTGRVFLAEKRVKLSRRALTVTLGCGGDGVACQGEYVLRTAGKVWTGGSRGKGKKTKIEMGKGDYAIGPGGEQTVKVEFTRTARKHFKRAGKVSAKLYASGGGERHTIKLKLRIKKSKRR